MCRVHSCVAVRHARTSPPGQDLSVSRAGPSDSRKVDSAQSSARVTTPPSRGKDGAHSAGGQCTRSGMALLRGTLRGTTQAIAVFALLRENGRRADAGHQ